MSGKFTQDSMLWLMTGLSFLSWMRIEILSILYREMPESRYNTDSEDLTRKTFAVQKVLKLTRDVLNQLMVRIPAIDEIIQLP